MRRSQALIEVREANIRPARKRPRRRRRMPVPRFGQEPLARLLGTAAGGSTEAFMAFYDATITLAYRHALLEHHDEDHALEAVRDRYVDAWLRAAEQRASGLSPAAWLLSLHSGVAAGHEAPFAPGHTAGEGSGGGDA